MQSVDIILGNGKADFLISSRCPTLLSLAMMSVMIIILLPALASEAFATDPSAQLANGRSTAVASAKIIRPYMMNSTDQPGTTAPNPALTLSHRTTYRSCKALLGSDAIPSGGASCELRLIELQ